MDERGAGGASIGVGALIAALSFIFIAFTAMNIIPNQPWGLQTTNYVIGCFGLIVGFILLGYGVYLSTVVNGYTKRIEALEREKAYQEDQLRQKEVELQLTMGKLRAARRRIERHRRQLRRVSGRLGDRTRRLKEIARLARIKRKELTEPR